MERLQEWFGTPLATAKTLAWVCWASFLVSVLLGVLYLLVWAVEGLVA